MDETVEPSIHILVGNHAAGADILARLFEQRPFVRQACGALGLRLRAQRRLLAGEGAGSGRHFDS